MQSPGVQVTVVDESFYLPAAPGTTPMIFVASAQDKINPSGDVAQGTTAENAGKIWLITGQRDLVDTFGTPLFYTDASGKPQHGSELNEYGLQAAYSALGVSSRVYVVRADLDTAQLEPTSIEPKGNPVAGTYWLDTDESLYGIKEWNSSTQKFTVKTPIVLNDDSSSSSFDGAAPDGITVGSRGDYCMVLTGSTTGKLYYKDSNTTWTEVDSSFDSGKTLAISQHYKYPAFTTSTATGSVWITTTTPSNGAKWSVKYYNGASQSWTTVSAPLYNGVNNASLGYDSTGGKNIAVGTLFVDTDPNKTNKAEFKLWRRNSSGETIAISNASLTTAISSSTFQIRESYANTTTNWSDWKTVTIAENTTTKIGSLIASGISAAGLTNVVATFNATSNKLSIKHVAGGDLQINETSGTPFASAGFTTSLTNVYAGPSGDSADYMITAWKPLTYESSANAPYTNPANGSLWYDSKLLDEIDIMIHEGSKWVGYRNFTGYSTTDPNGPIVSATEPTEQSGGNALVDGDIWIDTSDVDSIGKNIYVYNTTSGWVKQDTTDQSTPDGWLFADARWATTGTSATPSSIVDLLTSDFVDFDAPDPALYPKGMRLWNTRRSGFNVKKYITDYIDVNSTNVRMSNASMSAYAPDRWVSQYPTAEDGSPQFGRLAQRAQVVNALKETIDSNTSIRDTDTLVFNLLATPGYSEAIANMVQLNTDRKLTAFVVGDTPFRLKPTGTELSAWAKNTNNALDNNDVGATTYDEYMAMWYPSGYTNDNTGNYIVVPPSHMMLRTIINSDNKSYQWFAPAGTRRGGVDNATSVGYITDEGEFKSVALYEGLRDVLYDAKVNPIATLTGVGVVAYGQKTRARNASALDRINVARLVVYLRRQLDIMARPFLFEPNDAQTRREIKAAAESLLLELVGQRALYDFIVVCDETNNTSARIDRNELWLDIAVEPVKAVEYIYIPLRLKNTGDIAAGL